MTITSVVSHGSDEWLVTYADRPQALVPQDSRNRHAREVLNWLNSGNQATVGETSARRRVREVLKNDPLLQAIVEELALIQGRTRPQQLQALIDHIKD